MLNKYKIIVVLIIIMITMTACSSDESSKAAELEEMLASEKSQVQDLENKVIAYEKTIQDLELESQNNIEIIQQMTNDLEQFQSQNNNTLIQEALEVMQLFKDQDAAGLDDKVSPTRGVRFSPYQYVNINTDIVFYPGNTVPSMFTNTTVYGWGEYDGSGDTIAGEFLSYYARFVYDEDFVNPEIMGINTIVSSGNMINNIQDEYPNDQFVEFYFSGFDPQFDGMDWRSLTLVFEDDNGTWYLVGVIHGEWTI